MDACLRLDMFPKMMEHLPASNLDAVQASQALVEEADIYLGVFGFRYGHVPKGSEVSITEIEYKRAVEHGLPRLIFLMHEEHPLTRRDVETGSGAEKIQAFRKRLKTEKVVAEFRSAEELRGHVIDSLARFRMSEPTAFQYMVDVPTPPEPYIAHQYSLQARSLIGRKAELDLLTDWVSNPNSDTYDARIFNVVAMGGVGKSAVTWKWFNDIAPLKMRGLAGRLWWSFYETDSHFDNWIIRALAYVSCRPLEDIEKLSVPEREERLLTALGRAPFLIVLDGLERILLAYARGDAAHLDDAEVGKPDSASSSELPNQLARVFSALSEHQLRKTADPRAGVFLKRLAGSGVSRILVSTRLYPADLETKTGEPSLGCWAYALGGMADDDAIDLWRTFRINGRRDELIDLFHSFRNHPLLIQALACEIANFRGKPGDFHRWREANPEFDPFQLPLVQRTSHVLEFAVRGLNEATRKVLWHICAFRTPATYDTLAALLCGAKKLFSEERRLDAALTELEDRGLLGWDRRANRYDVHPIVRGILWGRLEDSSRIGIFGELEKHFRGLEYSRDSGSSFDDLSAGVELFHALIGLGRSDDAWNLFRDRLDQPTFYRLSANRHRAEMVEMLFPAGFSSNPNVTGRERQADVIAALASSYHWSDRPGASLALYGRANEIYAAEKREARLAKGLCDLSGAARHAGRLRVAEHAARRAFLIAVRNKDDIRRAISLGYLGFTWAARGLLEASFNAFQAALRLVTKTNLIRLQCGAHTDLAQWAIWSRDYEQAASNADRAWQLAPSRGFERDFIRAARLQGAAALGRDDLETAQDRLFQALDRSRTANFADGELWSLIGLAELNRRRKKPEIAREFLNQTWELAGRGPYPIHHAEAWNVMAELESDSENRSAAIRAATKAYGLAWCDGAEFAYKWGLERAGARLKSLGAPLPELPALDQAPFEDMPKVDIGFGNAL